MFRIRSPFRPRGLRRAGFSLIEVALALMVVAVGLLAVFGVFPVSLRSSQMARSDLAESAFAASLLQTLGGNIRAIDDIAVWNDPKAFWKEAARGTGLAETIKDDKNGSKHVYDLLENKARKGEWTGRADKNNNGDFSPKLTFVAANATAGEENVWYIAEENDKPTVPGDAKQLVKPAQFAIRLACVRREARRANDVRDNNYGMDTSDVVQAKEGIWKNVGSNDRKAVLPNVYIVSVISTDRGFPDVFIREPLFSQEFYFVHRP